MKNLLLLGVLVALADTVLLYLIWSHAGIEAALAVSLIPAFVGPRLVAWIRARERNREPDPAAMPAMIGDQLLLTVAIFLFVCPGPLTTLAALLLLIPGVRRWVQGWAVGHLKKVMSGGMTVIGGGESFVVSSVSGFPPGFGSASIGPSGPLKQAEGRVIDDVSLPPPTSSLPPPAEH